MYPAESKAADRSNFICNFIHLCYLLFARKDMEERLWSFYNKVMQSHNVFSATITTERGQRTSMSDLLQPLI